MIFCFIRLSMSFFLFKKEIKNSNIKEEKQMKKEDTQTLM